MCLWITTKLKELFPKKIIYYEEVLMRIIEWLCIENKGWGFYVSCSNAWYVIGSPWVWTLKHWTPKSNCQPADEVKKKWKQQIFGMSSCRANTEQCNTSHITFWGLNSFVYLWNLLFSVRNGNYSVRQIYRSYLYWYS